MNMKSVVRGTAIPRRTNIIWRNWEEMMPKPGSRKQEKFWRLEEELCDSIMEKCPEGGLIEWYRDYSEAALGTVVTYSIDNTVWPCEQMIRAMLKISAKYRRMVFMAVMTDGEPDAAPAERIYIKAGRLASFLFDRENGTLKRLY